MKKMFVAAAFTAVVAVVLCAKKPIELPNELKVSESEAQQMILTSLVEGYLSFPHIACKQISASKRPEIVKAVGAFARHYTQTELFKSQYAVYREDKRPSADENATGFDADQTLAEYKKSIAEAEQQLKTTTDPNMREGLNAAIKAMREQLAEIQRIGKEEKAALQEQTAIVEKARKEDFAKQLAEFEAMYPANPNDMLRKRLQEFLALAKTVDFSAATALKNGKQRFVNPEFEQKPGEWKLLYRAGKPTTDAAVAVASAWLQELEHSNHQK